MSDFDYDLFVIGGGSGGVRAARQAAATGARVALAEEYRLGGTCVIRGCVPKKLMVFASEFRETLTEARAYGWDIGEGRFDWPAFRGKLHGELDRLEKVYRKLLDTSGVEIFDARASFEDAHTLKVGDRTVTAKTILVATGGHPVVPDMPNAGMGLVSNDLFLLEDLPESLLIIGGGYIACEFAGIMNGLGVEVTQYYRGAQVLRGFDEEARGLIADAMCERGIDLHVGTNVVSMGPVDEEEEERLGGDIHMEEDLLPRARAEEKGPVRVKASNGTEKVFDRVLFATGRDPNTSGLGLEEVGVKLGRRGEIVVDDYSRSSVDHIYAIGDVTRRLELTPVAIREAMAFVQTVFHDNPTPVDHDLVPSAVFTQPEFGTIGLSEEEARDREPIEVYCSSFKAMRSAFAGAPDRAMMKLIVSRESRKILGCHIVAPHAGELIQLAGIAVKMGATKEDFDRVTAVHPTMAEELVTMREPVRTA